MLRVCVSMLKSGNDTYTVKDNVIFAVFELGQETILLRRLLRRRS
jgi:hypothetical protein